MKIKKSLSRALTKSQTKEKPKESGSKKASNIPQSSALKIIIEADFTLFQFQNGTYRSAFLEHLIDEISYNKIIKDASKVMYKSWLKKKQSDKVHVPPFFIKLISYSITMLFLYLSTLFFAPMVESNAIVMCSCVFLLLALILLIILLLSNHKKPIEKFRTLEEILHVDLEAHFEPINKEYANKLNFNYDINGGYIQCDVLLPNNLNVEGEEEKEESLENEARQSENHNHHNVHHSGHHNDQLHSHQNDHTHGHHKKHEDHHSRMSKAHDNHHFHKNDHGHHHPSHFKHEEHSKVGESTSLMEMDSSNIMLHKHKARNGEIEMSAFKH